MNDGAGRGVELPLNQFVLWSQLQHFVGIKEVLEWRPAVFIVCLENYRQFKSRGDTLVWKDVPHTLEAVLVCNIDLDGSAPEPAWFIS